MLGVARRAGLPVDLVELADDLRRGLPQQALGLQRVRPLPRRVVAGEQQEVPNVMVALDDEPAGHIGLAGAEPRIPGDVERRPAVGQPDGEGAVIGIGRAVMIGVAVMVDDGELALANQLAKHLVEQPHLRLPVVRL
jgi:hypothetical protein